jgi:chemotaxis protein CheC
LTAPLLTLDELERDALTELVNIGVSRAAVSLRAMVGEQVLLSVPSLEVMSRAKAAVLIGEREVGELVAVRQHFSGAFSGEAILLFPEENSLEWVRAVTGEVMSAAVFDTEAVASADAVVLFLYINVAINDRNIRGYIAMLMDIPSLEALRGLIGDFIVRVVGEGTALP